jgi:hypothetical protein
VVGRVRPLSHVIDLPFATSAQSPNWKMVFSRKLDRFLILRCGLNANGAKWQISRKQQEIRAIRLIRSIRAEKILVLEKTMRIGKVKIDNRGQLL